MVFSMLFLPIILTPLFFLLTLAILLAVVGKSFGLRKFYVQVLLKVFDVSYLLLLLVLLINFYSKFKLLVNVK